MISVEMGLIAVGDTIYSGKNGEVSFNPAANDSIDFVDDIGIVSLPNHGSVVINSDGSFTYSHDGECNVLDNFEYYIENNSGRDTASVIIDINCSKINIYSGFSPNSDNINDYFRIEGLEEFPNNRVDIFNRWGAKVYSTENYDNGNPWRGRWNNVDLPSGTYFYHIDLGDGSDPITGYVHVRR